MNFLKKFGTYVAKFVGIVTGLLPIGSLIGAAVPGAGAVVGPVVSEIGKIANVVVSVEAAFAAAFPTGLPGGGAAGVLKQVAAGSLVAQIVQASDLMAGKKIADEAGFIKGCNEVAGGFADILNAVNGDAVHVVDTKDVKV